MTRNLKETESKVPHRLQKLYIGIGLYLYPQNRGAENIELRMNSGSTYENNVCPRDDIMVFKCGLTIPNDSIDYNDFKVKIKKSEGAFKTRVLRNNKV